MATKDSQELKSDERYPLGDYSFRIERSAGTSPDYDKIEAICTKGGKNARKSIQIPSKDKLLGWYVEANETEASVYAVISEKNTPGGDPRDVNLSEVGSMQYSYYNGAYWPNIIVWADFPARVFFSGLDAQTSSPITLSYYAPKDIYQGNIDLNGMSYSPIYGPVVSTSADFYGLLPQGHASEEVEKTLLVGRFAIELKDAGGEGPGSDWEDPGDYDEDWEEGDPTHTLYVEVTGALSGRHNDPIVDPSYSYTPSDKDTVKDYGCGGDGGHGGGGGAGASTVIIHKFATNQANSKEVTALARRHGYGSGGGKGGKGGAGCILVFY